MRRKRWERVGVIGWSWRVQLGSSVHWRKSIASGCSPCTLCFPWVRKQLCGFPGPTLAKGRWGPSSSNTSPIMLQAPNVACSACCETVSFPSALNMQREGVLRPKETTWPAFTTSFPGLQRSLWPPWVGEKEELQATNSWRGGESGSQGCGGEQCTQLVSYWELLVKDTASPLDWNPGMDSQEWPGLLGQDSHRQEGKAGTQGRNYSLQSSSVCL